jgi:GNAT superfamily N-acetyltransferase
LEFAPSWFPASKEFNKILETGFFNINKRIILDLSGNNFGDSRDSYKPHPIRHMYFLVPKEDRKAPDSGEISKWINISRAYLVQGSCSKTVNLEKIKRFLKRTLPFIRYRWYIYEVFKKLPHLSFAKVRHLFYYRRSEKVGQKDLSQEISIPKNCKLEIEPLNELNKIAVREFAEKNHNNDLHSLRIRHYYINTYNGFIASLQGNIIGHIWWWAYNCNPKPPDEFMFYNLKLGKDGVYLFDFYIAPQYRGGGSAIEFMTRIFFGLRKLGYSRTSGVHDPNNLAARWTYKVVGEKDAKTINMHIFFNSIVYYDKAIFLKKWDVPDPCTSRMLLSFRKIFKS